MRRCQKCGAIAAEDATRCGVCGRDLFAVESESLQNAITNEELATAVAKKSVEQKELADERRTGRIVLTIYGLLVVLIVAGVILTTVRSDILNLLGIAFILFGLILIAFGALGIGPSARMRQRIYVGRGR